jgi:hypothetical protein
MALLAQMCPSREALDWLVDQMVNRVGIWKGPAELRGVLCWHFKPADGSEAESSIPGFRPADSEQLCIERHKAIREMETAAPLKALKGYLH